MRAHPLAGYATLGDTDPATDMAMQYLGRLLEAQGMYNRTEALLRKATETSRATMGDTHPHSVSCINSLGQVAALSREGGTCRIAAAHRIEHKARDPWAP